MNNEELKSYINTHCPEATFDETGEWLNVLIESSQLTALAQELKGQQLKMDFLFNLTCVDYKTHLTMVYHLTASTNRNCNLVIKVNLDRTSPCIDTLSAIWRTAEFLEREVFEMFGVHFNNHPDLRNLILEDETAIPVDEQRELGYNKTKGYWPLRKDFEDPINMIKL